LGKAAMLCYALLHKAAKLSYALLGKAAMLCYALLHKAAKLSYALPLVNPFCFV